MERTTLVSTFMAQSGCSLMIYSVLVHPNTDDELKDHTELCSWMGRPWPIDTSFLRAAKR
jgi:aromatic ring-cleaving dioxygenase